MNTFIRPLFPKFIFSTFYENSLTEENVDFLQKVFYVKNILNNVSIEKQILKKKELSNLNIFINNTLSDFVQKIFKPKNKIEVYITESWLNATKENEQHHQHRHSNSFLSGVFYIKTNPNDHIIFHDDYKMFDIESMEYNDFTMGRLNFNVKDNMLILFPSSVTHSVPENTSKDTRISIAFNTFLSGVISNSSGKSLNLK
jgi:uncharacterized protein (TIGR02466 family)